MAKLTVDIITAERTIYSAEGVDEVIAPGAEGELAILPTHAPLITGLGIGEMVIIKGAEEVSMAVAGGFLEVLGNHVTVLADVAERAEEIDVERARAAREQASQRVVERVSAVDLARAQASMQRALARMKVAERRRRRPLGPPGAQR